MHTKYITVYKCTSEIKSVCKELPAPLRYRRAIHSRQDTEPTTQCPFPDNA